MTFEKMLFVGWIPETTAWCQCCNLRADGFELSKERRRFLFALSLSRTTTAEQTAAGTTDCHHGQEGQRGFTDRGRLERTQ